jgi:hypothetical protein
MTRLAFLLVFLLIGCGDDITKKEIPTPPNNSATNNLDPNNTASNNISSNNTSTNNTSSNNTSTNNTSTNNTSTNNTSTNNTSTNNTTPDPVDPQVCILVDPGTITFADTPVGSRARAVVSIQNCSTTRTAMLNIIGIEVDGVAFSASAPIATEVPYGLITSFAVEFAPTNGNQQTGQIVVRSNAKTGPVTIPVSGKGIVNATCPTAVATGRIGNTVYTSNIAAEPLQTLELSAQGSMSSTGQPLSYEWSVIQRPTGSTASLSNPNIANPTMFLDLAGTYRFELNVYDNGLISCAPAVVFVQTTADGDIHVQLVWETPGVTDPSLGTDLDIHYLHPVGRWNNAPFDIFWRNRTADWGASGMQDDPTLDIDDTDGSGPENVNHSNPENLSYAVGVFYYADKGYGSSFATVRVYLNGALAYEKQNKELTTTGQFWDVARINWSSRSVTAIDTVVNDFPTP